MGTRPAIISPEVGKFVKQQAPGLQYLLSVCTGAWVLANAGLLDGKNATTNKAAFAQIRVRRASYLIPQSNGLETKFGETERNQ
jgi:transcriptional regulator GlxA family with amidase domain